MEDCGLMLVIELVSKWEICWALWNLVVFDPVDDPTQPDLNNVVWFLMEDLLRLSLWSGGLSQQAQVGALMDKPCPREKNFGPFYGSLWILCAGYRNRFWWLGFCCCCCLEWVWNTVAAFLFSLIIVKSLQLRERRQIAKPRKYYLVRVIVFFGVYFLYFFCFLQVGNFRLIPNKCLKFELPLD